MLDHEKVFRVAKQDEAFRRYVKDSGQKFPRFTLDSLEKGIWAAGYAGWVLGKYGADEYITRHASWELL